MTVFFQSSCADVYSTTLYENSCCFPFCFHLIPSDVMWVWWYLLVNLNVSDSKWDWESFHVYLLFTFSFLWNVHSNPLPFLLLGCMAFSCWLMKVHLFWILIIGFYMNWICLLQVCDLSLISIYGVFKF